MNENLVSFLFFFPAKVCPYFITNPHRTMYHSAFCVRRTHTPEWCTTPSPSNISSHSPLPQHRLSDSVQKYRWLRQDVSMASRLQLRTSTQKCTVFSLTHTSGNPQKENTCSMPLKPVRLSFVTTVCWWMCLELFACEWQILHRWTCSSEFTYKPTLSLAHHDHVLILLQCHVLRGKLTGLCNGLVLRQ